RAAVNGGQRAWAEFRQLWPVDRVSSLPYHSSLATIGGSNERLGPVSLHICDRGRGRATTQPPDRPHLGGICQSANPRSRWKSGRQGTTGQYPLVVRAAEPGSVGHCESGGLVVVEASLSARH